MITITLNQLLMQNMHLGLHKTLLHHNMEDFIIGIRNDFVIIDVSKSINNFRSGLYCFRDFGKYFYKLLFAMTYAIQESFVKKVKIIKQYFFRGRWVMGLLSNFFFTRIHLIKQHPLSNYKNKYIKYKEAWNNRYKFFKYTPRRVKILGFTKFSDFRFLAPRFTKEMRLADKRLSRIKFETSLLKIKLSNLSKFPSGIIFMGFADHSGDVFADARRVFGLTIGIMDSNNLPVGFSYTILGNNASSFSVEFLGHLIILATLQGKYFKLLKLKEVIMARFHARFNIWKFTFNYLNWKLTQILISSDFKNITKMIYHKPIITGFKNQFKLGLQKILFFNSNFRKKKQFNIVTKFFIYYLKFFEVKLFILSAKVFNLKKLIYENKILKFIKIWKWWFAGFKIKYYTIVDKIFYKLHFKRNKKYNRYNWFFIGKQINKLYKEKNKQVKKARKYITKVIDFILKKEINLNNSMEIIMNKNINTRLEFILYKKIGKIYKKYSYKKVSLKKK